uniref:AlNc14C30G2841 protein n=1 Tax=Albugo laibachii Nc14 TaxID=890382 RepID=F0W7N6_9STRA|nr:AlNc14C30G2841 [Albugo laibachii Nc14]|eukprot:CCA17137.1 AlNc14C30G2841 [Albugo laibachii Nc14]
MFLHPIQKLSKSGCETPFATTKSSRDERYLHDIGRRRDDLPIKVRVGKTDLQLLKFL